MRRFAIATLTIVALVAGCTSQPMQTTDEERYASLNQAPETTSARNSDTFRRRIDKNERFQGKVVNYAATQTTLVEAIREGLPNVNVIPDDLNVDLRMEIAVRATDMPVKSYLHYLESVSGYELEIQDSHTILAKSFVSKRFNMAALTSNRYTRTDLSTKTETGVGSVGNNGQEGTGSQIQSASTGSSGTGNSTGTTAYVEAKEDEWVDLIDGARNILGVEDSDDTDTLDSASQQDQASFSEKVRRDKFQKNRKPFVTGSRSTGVVVAGGTPERMRLVQSLFDGALDLATKQVRADLKLYDVTLKDSAAQGIDWNALSSFEIDGNPLNLGLTGSANFINGENVWGLSTSYESADVSVDSILKFLKTYGRTELLNEPSILVRNGSTAFINAGDQLSIIGGFVQNQDVNGNVTQSPVFNRIQIGVSLQVTARILSDERIMLDIVPVVSSITGGDSFTVNGNDFTIPRTSLQQLSTQVITRSGRPIQLGGLITRKIANELSGLPFRHGPMGKIFNFVFDSNQNDFEKRELVLILTPKIVEEV